MGWPAKPELQISADLRQNHPEVNRTIVSRRGEGEFGKTERPVDLQDRNH